MTTETTYTNMTVEHLGQGATEADLVEFTAACDRINAAFRTEAEATDYVWNNGSILFDADLCAYCHSIVADRTIVPDAGDDEGWAALSADHEADCEWFVTRAHWLPNES
jgi:hypothetical protein